MLELDFADGVELIGEFRRGYYGGMPQDYSFVDEGFLPLVTQKLEDIGLGKVTLTPYTYTQYPWFCDRCKIRGAVNYSPYNLEGKGVESAIQQAHYYYSQRCTQKGWELGRLSEAEMSEEQRVKVAAYQEVAL